MQSPRVYMIGGPNGAGKTTTAIDILPGLLDCEEYVNADSIAAGLSPFKPHEVAIDAGRLMLQRIRDLADKKADFAFETTMASRSFVPFIAKLRQNGYIVELLFVWLRSSDLAIARVAQRVNEGGHNVPSGTVEARYHRGITNFFRLYRPLAHNWSCYDNSGVKPVLIAKGSNSEEQVADSHLWKQITETYA